MVVRHKYHYFKKNKLSTVTQVYFLTSKNDNIPLVISHAS